MDVLGACRCLLAATALLSMLMPPAVGDEYRLGPQDKVKIKAYDWRPGSDDTHEWAALTGGFTVSASGKLSLPIVGDVAVARSTTSDVAHDIAVRLQQRLGLANAPFVSIEISEFRPFYILGGVQKPGEYAYRPSLTMLQAVSVAGGLLRPADASLAAAERDVIVNRGDLRALSAQRLQLLVRQARLKAQIDEAAQIGLPSEIAAQGNAPAFVRLVKEETQLFDSTRRTLAAQLAINDQTKLLLQQEVASLAIKEKNLAHQIDLTRSELTNVSGLVSRGLAVTTHQTSVEQALAQLESSTLDVKLAQLTAQQRIGQADRDSLELKNKAKSMALADANEVRAKLAELEERIKATRELLDEVEDRLPAEVDSGAADRRTSAVYYVTRESDGKVLTTSVAESDRVAPGDTIRVVRQPVAAVSASRTSE